MSTCRDRVAEVLAEHAPRTDIDCLIGCRCQWSILGRSVTLAEFAAHQAEMLAAAGLLPETTTAYAVRWSEEVVDYWGGDEQAVRSYARSFVHGPTVVRCERTAWVPADEGGDCG